jgi:hypothetical protein
MFPTKVVAEIKAFFVRFIPPPGNPDACEIIWISMVEPDHRGRYTAQERWDLRAE